jgi:Holliday junction DNA helicase RuvA
MICYIAGKVIDSGINFISVMAGGIGYKIFVVPEIIENKKINKKISLFIHQHVRENELSLYGFKTSQDLELFEHLLSVSGVGPKGAMNILSRAKAEDINKAIANNNPEIFTVISGVGPKMANRIIIELKNKIIFLGKSSKTLDLPEVVEALKELGYHLNEINKVIVKIPDKIKTSQGKVKWALKELGR